MKIIVIIIFIKRILFLFAKIYFVLTKIEPDKKRNSPKVRVGEGFCLSFQENKKKKIQLRNLKTTGRMSESSEERGVIQRKFPKKKSKIDQWYNTFTTG